MSFRNAARRTQSHITSSQQIRRAVAEALEPRRLFASVPITNASFEDTVLADGQTSATAAGWKPAPRILQDHRSRVWTEANPL